MTLYILRRLVQLIPVLLLASFIVFFIIHLIPGDPVEVMLGEGRYSQETYELLRKKMGLDEPLHIQYLHWLNRILHGDRRLFGPVRSAAGQGMDGRAHPLV